MNRFLTFAWNKPSSTIGCHTLPRENRDTLFLLAVVAWVLLPHVTHLPWWCSVLCAVLLLRRAQLAVFNGPLPSRRILVAALALGLGLTLWEFKTLLGKDAGIALTALLLALKTLELRAKRDAFVVFFLGFFVVLSHFLVSQSLLVAASMVISVWALLTALVLAHMPQGYPSLLTTGWIAARASLLGAPIMVLLFVLFPRMAPLWGVPQEATATTGLSDTLELGQVAEVALDESIAMRLRFFGPAPSLQNLYFRGPVLSVFDGRKWAISPSTWRFTKPVVHAQSRPLHYEVTLEPQRLRWLPLLEATLEVAPVEGQTLQSTHDLQWLSQQVISQRLRFKAWATLSFTHGALQSSATAQELREALQLPQRSAPKVRIWAQQLAQQLRSHKPQATTQDLVQAVLQHIRTTQFVYTLAPGTYGQTPEIDALDEFWLYRRTGFCEHYAAAFVVVLRAMNVPARLVTGYQGADPTPVDGYWVVRQSAAHAWVEYWQEGTGWQRADPTAAVAPERVLQSRQLTQPSGWMANTLGQIDPALWTRWRDTWESLNNRWNQWVLNYARQQQFDLLKRLGFEQPSWEDLARLLVISLSTLALSGALWLWWDRRVRRTRWQHLLHRIQRQLKSAGFDCPHHLSPLGWAELLQKQSAGQPWAVEAQPLAELLQQIGEWRYAGEGHTVFDREWQKKWDFQLQRLRKVQKQFATSEQLENI